MDPRPHTTPASRREFLVRSTLGGAALAGGLSLTRSAHAAGNDVIRVGLVGCGRRGSGAAVNALNNAAGAKVKLVAMADAFLAPLDVSLKNIQKAVAADKVDVAQEQKFAGLDSFQKLLEADLDMVLLCSPPGFRPAHFEAAVKAGKHVFMEKPVAVDGPGVRRVLAANEEAKKKGLRVAVGHHLRHEDKYREIVKRIHDGAIGNLKFLRVYFNSDGVWVRPRKPGQTELEYQVSNWYYFNWLSGDHIVEQHVHDIDIGNWIAGARPETAEGIGGRQVRIGKDNGEIFDHHVVEYTYANGLKMFSQSRQIPNTEFHFEQHAHGTKGLASMIGVANTTLTVDGEKPVRWKPAVEGHQAEMDHLFTAMLAGEPYNEGDRGAESTLTAIMGRMATYSGHRVTWDNALSSKLELGPKTLAWDAEPPVKPGPDGLYPCAIPGVTKAW